MNSDGGGPRAAAIAGRLVPLTLWVLGLQVVTTFAEESLETPEGSPLRVAYGLHRQPELPGHFPPAALLEVDEAGHLLHAGREGVDIEQRADLGLRGGTLSMSQANSLSHGVIVP